MEDREIIELYKAGQSDIMDILVDRYKNPLYKLCRHLTENAIDADDLFQETWVKAVKNIKRCDAEKLFLPWLYTICTNLYKDRYRTKKRWLSRIKYYFTGEEEEPAPFSPDNPSGQPEDELIEKYDHEAIRKFVNMLDDIYRLPVILYYFKEISYEDIGVVLSIPVGTVKSRLYMAKQKLRKMMEVDGFEI